MVDFFLGQLPSSRIFKCNALGRKPYSWLFAVMINEIDEKFSSFSSSSQYIIHSRQIMQAECGKTAEAWLHFTADVAPAHLVYLLLKLLVRFSAT